MEPLVIEMPSPLGLRPSGLEFAPDALRAAGLYERLGAPDPVRIAIPPYSGARDEQAGILKHPADEPNGEVASLDLAVATGRGPDVLTDLDGLRPLVRDEDVALIGYRVLDDNDHFGDEHIRSTAITTIDLSEVRDQGIGHALESAMTTVTKPGLDGFWVHLDVDVLDDAIMPAVDYRHPDGLSWPEATVLLGGLLASEKARGLEVTIFNPGLAPDNSLAGQLSSFIADVMF